MVFPLEITATIGGAWPVGTKLNWQFTENGHEIYYAENAPYLWHSIKVNPLTNVWSDHGTHDPTPDGVVEETIDGVVYVALYYDNPQPLLLKFPKPTVASWISTGPNTNSVSDAFVSYLVEDNELRVYIPLDKPSTVGTDMYYQLRKISGTSFFTRIVHTQGIATNETIVPTTAGIYQLEKVQSSPYITTTYDTAEVTQAQLDFYAANNPPDDDPPDDDPPENDPPPTPVFVPRSARRGNLNFW